MEKVRLQKLLAQCGVASRRKAEELIINGNVKVNGVTAQIGDKVDPQKDKVYVRGKRISTAAKNKYYYVMLHKPRGYVTTMSDEKDRKCVADLVKDVPARVYPVGRLDRESEGLLLLTNDGDFANKVTHPSKHVYKVYRVTVRPSVNEEQVRQMRNGMELPVKSKGKDAPKKEVTAPCEVRIVSREEGRVVLEIILREGKNRQIRRMCKQLGLEVARLKRVAIGQVKLGGLPQGKWRELSADEVRRLTAPPNTTVDNYGD